MSDAINKLLSQLTGNENGGLGALFAKLNSGGLADEVKSWIGHGENKPVTGDQVTKALGDEQVAKMAEQTGVSPQEAADHLAQALPKTVDKLTPDGQMPDPQALQDGIAKLVGTGTRAS